MRSILEKVTKHSKELLNGEFDYYHCEFQTAKNNIINILSAQNIQIQPNTKRKFFINRLYTLGTPHFSTDIAPDMNTIEYLFNVYPEGDHVSNYLVASPGSLPASIRNNTRIKSISVEIPGTGFNGYPNHYQMHHDFIAQWILSISLELQSNNLGNFDKFSFDHDAHVIFNQNSHPEYIPLA